MDLNKEREDAKNLIAQLEDQYRKSSISEKSYQELKERYSKKLEDLNKQSDLPVDESSNKSDDKKPEKSGGGMLSKLFGKKSGEEKKDDVEKKDAPVKEGNKPKKEEAPKEEKKQDDNGEPKMYGTGSVEDPYRSTPEVQKPEEVTEEAVKPKEESTDFDIEIEKIKVMIDNLRQTKQATDESIRAMSESIGELRSMVFQTDASLKENESKMDKIGDEISEVKPDEITKKFRESSKELEDHQMSIEKFERKFEDITGKINQTYDMLKTIGGIENLVDINKNLQKKIEEIKEDMRYIERLSLKAEKVYMDLNRSLEDFMLYKIKQDGLSDSVNDLVKSADATNLKFDNYATKKDLQKTAEEMILLRKEIEEINKSLPMTKLKMPEPVMALIKERDGITEFIDSLEEQSKNGKISIGDYEKIKKENQKKISDIEGKIKSEWGKILEILQSEPAEEPKEEVKHVSEEVKQNAETLQKVSDVAEKAEGSNDKKEDKTVPVETAPIKPEAPADMKKTKKKDVINIIKNVKDQI